MLTNYSIVRESASKIADAAKITLEAFNGDRVEQEHQFTDRMLGAIEYAMDGFIVKGVKWTAKTLTDKGPNTQEKRYGADFIGVLEINLPDYSVKKGFLAQSKIAEPGIPLSKSECSRMKKQCEQLLNLSPDSFLFVYSKSGIYVMPAISVVSMKGCNPFDLYSMSLERFYEVHFESFIGDRKIYAANPKTLEDLLSRFESRKLLNIGLSKPV